MKTLPALKKAARVILIALAAVAGAAVVAAAALWFSRYAIARRVVSAALPHGEGLENTFTIKRLGLGGVELADVRLGGFPCAPSFRTFSASWSIGGLREKRIDSVALEGLAVDFTHKPENFSMPSAGGVGPRPLQKDILMGWRIDRASAGTAELDLAPFLAGAEKAGLTLPAKTAKLSLRLDRTGPSYKIAAKGTLLGKPVVGSALYRQDAADGTIDLRWTFPDFGLGERQRVEDVSLSMLFAFAEARGVECSAEGWLGVGPCAWRLPVEAGAKADGSFSCKVSAEGIMLTGKDPLVADILDIALGSKVPDKLEFSANVSPGFEISGAGGAASWQASVSVSEATVSAPDATVPFSVENARLRGSAEGAGALIKIKPCMVGFDGATVGAVPLGRSYAMLMPDNGRLMISEASFGFCGGAMRLYALYLNLENLTAGFTLFLDNLEMSEFLALFPRLKGSTATGRLYGRMPLRFTKEAELRLGESFLYTPPGETGSIQIADPAMLTSLLAQSGLPDPVCESLGRALRNMEYEVFRLDLVHPRDEDGRLEIKLRGKTAGGAAPTPVNFNTNINGPIEKLLNLAIKTARMKESFKQTP